MQPTCRQVPPTLLFSMMAMSRPADAPYSAAAYPPGPPPMMATSWCVATSAHDIGASCAADRAHYRRLTREHPSSDHRRSVVRPRHPRGLHGAGGHRQVRNALGAVQSALVLGGGSDIAQATLRELVPAGCRTVVLAAREPAALAGQVAELTDLGATTVRTIAFDATDVATHAPTVDKCFDEHGDIDLVVIAFGVLGHGAGIDTPPDVAADAVITNYVGAVSSGLAAAKRLRGQGHGTIVVLSSVAGERA